MRLLAILLTSCTLLACSHSTPQSVANWACQRIVEEGADPNDILTKVAQEVEDDGLDEAEVYRALSDTCGVELGLVP